MYRLAVLCYCATWASGRWGRGSRVGSKRAEGETRVQLSSAEKAAVVEVLCPSCCQYVGSIAQQAHSELYNQAKKHPQLFFCAPTAY